MTLGYIRVADLETYLQALESTGPDFRTILDEHAVLIDDWNTGRTNAFWTRVFAGNLVLRIQAYSRTISTLKPANAELRRLHDQLQEALQVLEKGISDFGLGLDPPDSSILERSDDEILRFYEIVFAVSDGLSGLAGRQVEFLIF